jgi:DNA polymerase-3 subunit epsilon
LFQRIYEFLKQRPEGADPEDVLALVLQGPGGDSTFGREFLRGLLAEDPRFFETEPGGRWSASDTHVLKLSLADADLVVVDIETTGQRISETGVTEIGAVRLRNLQPVGRFDRLVNPGRPIPPYVAQLTGISDAMVADAAPLEEVLPEFERFARGAVLVAHNAAFDAALLDHYARRFLGRPLGLPAVCTLKLARRWLPELERISLDALREHFVIEPGNGSRHRALADAELTAQVFTRLLALERREDLRTVADLVAAQEDPNAERKLQIRIPRAVLERLPSSAGVFQLASDAGACLYVARASDVRGAVAHMFFGASHLSDRQLRMLSEAVDVEAVPVAGELEARVIEAEWIRKRRPEYNRSDRHLPKGFFVRLARRGAHPRLVVAARIAREGDLYIGPIKGKAFAEEAVVAIARTFDLPRAGIETEEEDAIVQWGAASDALDAALRDDGHSLRARMDALPDGIRERCLATLGRLSKLRRGDRSWLANRPDVVVASPSHGGALLLFLVTAGVCQRYARVASRSELQRFVVDSRRLLAGSAKRISVVHADVSTILSHALRGREDGSDLVVIPIDEANPDRSLAKVEQEVGALLSS